MRYIKLIETVNAHGGDNQFDNHMFMNFPFFGFGGGFIMVIFWGALIWLAVYLVQKTNSHEDKKDDKAPLDILKERYAKGEINSQEFKEMKKNLVDK